VSTIAVVGNPKPLSRTRAAAELVVERLTGAPPDQVIDVVDLGAGLLGWGDASVGEAVAAVRAAEVAVVASPTYKATYSGLLKAFLDRLSAGSLAGAAAVPILLGGAPNHQLAVEVHFAPLLLELGARLPARGLFVLESEVSAFPDVATHWAQEHARILLAPAWRR
jgi:FMN reductase